MRRIVIILLLAALLLTGCSPAADPHPEWDNLARADNLLAAETPEGFTLNESKGALSLQNVYYFSWSKGDGTKITNAQGENAVVYDCQIYLLAAAYPEKAEAQANADKWLAMEAENYSAEDASFIDAACGSFRCMTLVPQAGSPFTAGAAAFAVHGNIAISVEIFSANEFDEDLTGILEGFLQGIHMD